MPSPSNAGGRYWLHVPLETTRGDWLTPPIDGRLTVLGRPATLYERSLPNLRSLTSNGSSIMLQWLLFDPMPSTEAASFLEELRDRLPVAAFYSRAALRIGATPLARSSAHIFEGKIPTLVPESAGSAPSPAWTDVTIQSYLDAVEVLERDLAKAPKVTDIRVRTAIDLSIACRYDFMPRSKFLAYLTILDSLAVHTERPRPVIKWLEKALKDSEWLGDSGLTSALSNLRYTGHGSSVRELVKRAAAATNRQAEAADLAKLAGQLYGVRSALSHAGQNSTFKMHHVGEAEKLAGLVLDAAISDATVLDP